jgi:uncharacterized protein (TIGR02145 family)
MNKFSKIASFCLILMSFLVGIWSCTKEPSKEVPVVTTSDVKLTLTPANTTLVTGGGEVTSQGTSSVSARGVCWSVKDSPTNQYKDSLTTDGKGLGIYTSTILKLKVGITYYVRAYATNSTGTGYGEPVTTKVLAVIPILTTNAIVAISDTVIKSGGNISSDGGSPVTARGVCWSTSKNPTTANSCTKDGTGTGAFISIATKLSHDSTYYLRSYATNSAGTAYGNESSFSAARLLVADRDGNFYHFITIGSQVWMTENLKTTRYRDSTAIPFVEDMTTWGTQLSAAYCWYNYDEFANKNKYGALYNWTAVNTGKLCPTGWHVPSDAEWTLLTASLNGESLAGGLLKESGTLHWKSPNAGANNDTGFTALPGGDRTNSGEFENLTTYGNWWSSTIVNTSVANYRYMYYGNGTVTKSFVSQKYGLSVRCLKN